MSGVSERYLPALTKPIQDKTPERAKKDRELLIAAMAGTLDQQRFTENMRKSFFPQKANQIQKDTTGLRRIQSFVLVEEGRNEREHRTYRRYRAVFAKDWLRFHVELNDHGAISDFRVSFE